MTAISIRALLLSAVMCIACCAAPSCASALTVEFPGAEKDAHKRRVQELLQHIANGIDSIDTEDEFGESSVPEIKSFNRWHGARKELPEILREDDIPAMKKLFTENSQPGLSDRNPIPPEKQDRADFAMKCMDILIDYYIRTNDPQVTEFFVELLHSENRGHLGAMLHRVKVPGVFYSTSKQAFLPGIEKTDWPEALHREYLKLDTTEALIRACEMLYAGEKYKDEATWVLCRVLKEPEWVVSEDKLKSISAKRREHGAPMVTAREEAIIEALGLMASRAWGAQDQETVAAYVIPWCKHLAAEGTPEVSRLSKYNLDPDLYKGWNFDLDAIPAGTPVPPKPKTVIEPKDEKTNAK